MHSTESIELLKIDLKKLIPSGLDLVLKTIKQHLPYSTEKFNAFIELESRYQDNHKQLLRGVINNETYNLNLNRIREAVIEFIDTLELIHFSTQAAPSIVSDKFRSGTFFYRIPKIMQVEVRATCLVRIAFDEKTLTHNLEVKYGDEIKKLKRVSEIMSAELIDPTNQNPFKISTPSNSTQFVDDDDYTEWVFFVTPLKEGEFPLVIKISVIEMKMGQERKRDIILEEQIQIITEEPLPDYETKTLQPLGAVLNMASPLSLASIRSIDNKDQQNAKNSFVAKIRSINKSVVILLMLLISGSSLWAVPRVREEVRWIKTAYIVDSKEAFESYKAQYPKSHRIQKIDQKIENFEWEEVLNSTGREKEIELDDYLNKYANLNSAHLQEAKNLKQEITPEIKIDPTEGTSPLPDSRDIEKDTEEEERNSNKKETQEKKEGVLNNDNTDIDTTKELNHSEKDKIPPEEKLIEDQENREDLEAERMNYLGRIIDSFNEKPLGDVLVYIDEVNIGQSDDTGDYSLDLSNYKNEEKEVVFRLENYEEKRIALKDLIIEDLYNLNLISLAPAEVKVFRTNEATINSKDSEHSPYFFEDGILFIQDEKLFFSRRDETGLLTEPILFKNGFEDRKKDKYGAVCTDRTGEFMYYTKKMTGRKNKAKDGKLKLQIFTREKLGDSWMNEQILNFISKEYNFCSPSLNVSSDVLFYSSDQEGGFGGMDIWMVEKQGDTWGEPVNLGPEINTSGNENNPFLHPDGSLYFASDGHSGLGGLDIYSAKNIDDAWTKVKNLGPNINSPQNDFGFIIDRDKKNGYFSSNRLGGMGRNDIYSIYIHNTLE